MTNLSQLVHENVKFIFDKNATPPTTVVYAELQFSSSSKALSVEPALTKILGHNFGTLAYMGELQDIQRLLRYTRIDNIANFWAGFTHIPDEVFEFTIVLYGVFGKLLGGLQHTI